MPRFKAVMPRLAVADIGRTVEFYTNLLGFSEDLLWPEDQPTYCILNRDDVRLSFFAPEDGDAASAAGTTMLNIEVEDVQGLHKALKDKIKIEWGPEVYFYGRREFAILDPDGYMLIFTEPTDDPPTCLDE